MAGNGHEPAAGASKGKEDLPLTPAAATVKLSTQEVELILLLLDRTQLQGLATIETAHLLAKKLKAQGQ